VSARNRLPAKRLLVGPTLLLIAILAIVMAVPTTTDRAPDPAMRAEVPPALVFEGDCRRGREADAERPPLVADAGRVTSGDLLSCPAEFDGLSVTYVGELVGDLLHRPGGAWVLVNDDDYALRFGPLPTHGRFQGANSGLSVWLPEELHGAIAGLGRPGQRGDVVQLEGEIERTDAEDGGGLTLRANDLTLLARASTLAEPFDRAQGVLAAVTLALSVGLWTVRRRAGP
jgi:hypothetical protein